jgi:hypothetical protein
LLIEVLLILTVFVFNPVVVGRSKIVIVLGEFLTNVPKLQVIVLLAKEQLPCVEPAETKLIPAGSTSVTFTCVAVDLPLLTTLAV